jgi:diguanylate cyclase (GGDEF)-like protein/PAS domain S-box-containing protein
MVRGSSKSRPSIERARHLVRLLDAAVEEIYLFEAVSLRLVEANRGARRNLGYRAARLSRMTPLDLSEGLDADVFRGWLKRLRTGEAQRLVYRSRHRRADASSYPVEVRLGYLPEETPPLFVAVASDISERESYEAQLQRLAHYDPLTGLPNRALLYERLRQALPAASRGGRELAVMFLDLDGFKQVNDRHGHEIGDQVLRALSARMAQSLRASDTVARLGGDEFIVLAPGQRSYDDARALAGKLLETIAQPLDVGGNSLTVTASIGITLYPSDEADLESLLRHADHAMYAAKNAGRACFRCYGEPGTAVALSR